MTSTCAIHGWIRAADPLQLLWVSPLGILWVYLGHPNLGGWTLGHLLAWSIFAQKRHFWTQHGFF